MSVRYAYIESVRLGNGEVPVCGMSASGKRLFGFRTFDDPFKSWRQTARNYVPSGYVPVFQPNRPAQVVTAPPKIFRARA
jgi:hypothetical protein